MHRVFDACVVALIGALLVIPGRTVTSANPIPVGSCCLPDGRCLLLPPDECAADGGSYLGTESCEPNPCPQPAACCFPDGTCRFETIEACNSQHGVWFGGGSTCSPNPCVCFARCLGACCRTDGSCVISLQQDCQGAWYFDGVCQPSPCPTSGVKEEEPAPRSWGKLKHVYR
jgi:hypothetical protein